MLPHTNQVDNKGCLKANQITLRTRSATFATSIMQWTSHEDSMNVRRFVVLFSPFPKRTKTSNQATKATNNTMTGQTCKPVHDLGSVLQWLMSFALENGTTEFYQQQHHKIWTQVKGAISKPLTDFVTNMTFFHSSVLHFQSKNICISFSL